MMHFAIYIFADSVCIFCYLMGIFLVMVQRQQGKIKMQHHLWLNWSGFVLLNNLINIFCVVAMHCFHTPAIVIFVPKTLQVCLSWFMITSMIFINIDRLLFVILGINYPFYLTVRRGGYLIRFMWITALFTFFAVLFSHGFGNLKILESARWIMKVSNTYIGVIFDFLYVVSAIVIYAIIFHHFVVSRRRPGFSISNVNSIRRIKETYAAFRKSRFYMALLLVLSFALFIVVPDIILTVYSQHPHNGWLIIIFGLSVRVCWTLDVIIFVLMDSDVRQWLRRRKSAIACQREVSRCNSSRSDIKCRQPNVL